MKHPPFILALTLSLAAVAGPAMAKPQCWELQPGPSPNPAMIAWWGGGKKLLETPANWDTQRAYKELKAWGFCTDKPTPKPTPQPTQEAPRPEEAPRVKSSREIILDRLEKAEQPQQGEGKNSWAMVLFIGGVIWAIISTAKEEDPDPLKKLKRERGLIDFHSGITEPSPWLADQVKPLPSPAQVTYQGTQEAPRSTPEPAPTHTPEPQGSQGFGAKFGEGSEPGSEKSSEQGSELSPDQARQTFLADSPYCIYDDDCFVKAVIRLGITAGLKKAEIQNAFFWLKPEGEDSYKRSPITKGGNEPYARFTELFTEVVSR